jgi:hypothetical protein
MRITRTLTLACAAAALAGCASRTRSVAERPLPVDVARDGRVDIVNVDYVPVMRDVGPDFPYVFTRQVKKRLASCARGARPLRLDASVTEYVRTEPLVTTVLIGRNRIRGVAVLTDLETGREVGRYRIGRITVGGPAAIPAMIPAEARLSAAFGNEVCRRAFGRRAAEAE